MNFQTTPSNAASLAVQELHDGLQDVIGVLGDAAGVPHVGGALHLSQDVSHLLHVLLDVRLEASGTGGDANSEVWTAQRRGVSFFLF